MKNNASTFFYLLLITVLFQSCAAAYVPNAVNVPMLSNKGELQVAANFGFSGFDPQIAYGVTNNIGLMANGSFFNGYTSDTISTDYSNHNYGEIGLGYYMSILKVIRVELYAGKGYGEIYGERRLNEGTYLTEPTQTSSSKFRLSNVTTFIQPSIGFSTKAFDCALSNRLIKVEVWDKANVSSNFFMTPVITFKLGYDRVKIISQQGICIPMTTMGSFLYQPFIFSFGIQYRFN